MTTHQPFHILAMDIMGPAKASQQDLNLSLDILSELMASSAAFEIAKTQGLLTTRSADSSIYALSQSEQSVSLLCALDLWETLHELPAMSVRIALHSGIVEIDPDGSASGSGIDQAHRLLATGQPGRITVSKQFSDSLRDLEGWSDQLASSSIPEARRLIILESRNSGSAIVDDLESALTEFGHETSRDTKGAGGMEWATSLEPRIRAADAVVVFVSEDSAEDELLLHQLEIAVDERRKRGRPHIIPIWLVEPPSEDGPLGSLARNLRQATWRGEEDTDHVVEEVQTVLSAGQAEIDTEWLDPVGGAISETSRFYVRRGGDDEFESALEAHDSIVLLKGPRQIGKTSLIGRGIRMAHDRNWRFVTTDFQKLSSDQLESASSFYRVLSATLARQTGFEYDFETEWLDGLTETMNMDEFVRALINQSDRPLVWFMDEADRLFGSPFCSEFFGLVRSWHNARATDRRGYWNRFTIVVSYATEVHLFIKDINLSPFNVGSRINLPMFAPENIVDLNERYHRPIAGGEDLNALYSLLGGQPYLTGRAFEVLARGNLSLQELFEKAADDDGPFGDHLKRILVSVSQLPEVWRAIVESLKTPDLADGEGLQRLVAAGVLVRGESGYELPCELYRRYLARFAQESTTQ